MTNIYTKKEVAEMLKVSQGFIDVQMRRKNIGFTKHGNFVRFTEKHVTEFIKKGESK